jgi:hypothetical protein
MNRLSLLVVAGLVASGCVPTDSDSPIRVLGAQLVPSTNEGGCEFADTGDPLLTRGSMDVSARTSFFIQFNVESNLQATETQVGGDTIAGPERNDFIAEQQELNYTLSGTSVSFEQETVQIYSVIRPGDTARTIVDLIGPKAYATLLANVPAGTAAELVVTMQLVGRLASGPVIRSTEATFPITVFNSGFTGCPAGTGLDPTGPCSSGGGQNGVPPQCCPVDATTGALTCPS